jgi:protein-S-isoprenylcysteine O-methyltransferase Ste14
MPESNNNQAQMAAVKQLIVTYAMLSLHVIVFFVAAGHIAVRPWIFFGVSFLHSSLGIIVQYKLNPELLAVRLKVKREGSKLWDEILMRVSNLTVLIAVPVIAGLDIGRFNWSSLDFSWVVVGLLLLVVYTILLNWAMIVNPHFESTVRVQKDRDHKVITRGPYRIVRHPGYLAGILNILSIPLIMGSLFTFIPVGIYILLMITRTILEDKTLQKELNGYSEYAKKVRYKLFPWVW